MTFLLHCTTPTAKHRWMLRRGELCVGTSSWVEFNIADDPELSDEHFSLSYSQQLCVQSIGNSPIDVNGTTTASSTLRSGATIHAGNCIFEFTQVMAQEFDLSKTERTALATGSDFHNTQAQHRRLRLPLNIRQPSRGR